MFEQSYCARHVQVLTYAATVTVLLWTTRTVTYDASIADLHHKESHLSPLCADGCASWIEVFKFDEMIFDDLRRISAQLYAGGGVCLLGDRQPIHLQQNQLAD